MAVTLTGRDEDAVARSEVDHGAIEVDIELAAEHVAGVTLAAPLRLDEARAELEEPQDDIAVTAPFVAGAGSQVLSRQGREVHFVIG